MSPRVHEPKAPPIHKHVTIEAGEWGAIESSPVRTADGERYPWPGGKMFTYAELEELCRHQGWKLRYTWRPGMLHDATEEAA